MCNRILTDKSSKISFLLKGNSVMMIDYNRNDLKEILKVDKSETFYSQCCKDSLDNLII